MEKLKPTQHLEDFTEQNSGKQLRPAFVDAAEIVRSAINGTSIHPKTNLGIDIAVVTLLTSGVGHLIGSKEKVSRRNFLKRIGIGSLGLGATLLVGCKKSESGNKAESALSGTKTTDVSVEIRENLFEDLNLPASPTRTNSPTPTDIPTDTPTETPVQQVIEEVKTPEPLVDYNPPPDVEPGGGNKVILTFDDSGSQANSILDIMARYGAKGFFFPTGQFAASDPNVVQRMYYEGHLVCNHTHGHADLTTLSYEGVRSEILNGAGVGTCDLLRPPYGSHNGFVDSIAADMGYRIYMWDVDTRDWARRYPGGDQEILNIALSEAFPGAVILMHMHIDNTVYALPGIIEGLQNAGYTLSW